MMDQLFEGEAPDIRAALKTPLLWALWLVGVVWMLYVGAPVLTAAFALLLLLLAFVDIRTFTLPRTLTWTMAVMGIAAWATYGGTDGASFSLLGGILGAGSFWLLRWFSLNVLKKDGLGKGDITLFGAIGMWVGPVGLPLVALVGSLLAVAYLLAKRPGWGKQIPFGPYLCAGAWVVWLHQGLMWRWLGLQ